MEGLLELSINYGRPGNRKYNLSVRQGVVLVFNAEGLLINATSHDVA